MEANAKLRIHYTKAIHLLEEILWNSVLRPHFVCPLSRIGMFHYLIVRGGLTRPGVSSTYNSDYSCNYSFDTVTMIEPRCGFVCLWCGEPEHSLYGTQAGLEPGPLSLLCRFLRKSAAQCRGRTGRSQIWSYLYFHVCAVCCTACFWSHFTLNQTTQTHVAYDVCSKKHSSCALDTEVCGPSVCGVLGKADALTPC